MMVKVLNLVTRSVTSHRRLALVLSLFAFLCLEEAYFARVRNIYRNYYVATVPGLIHIHRSTEQKSVGGIAILTVLKDHSNKEEYRLAQETFQCYAIHHQYTWLVVDLSLNQTLQRLCPQKDFMFTRHCVAAEVMQHLNEDWILFIDADMGVINPNHLIEEWIDPDFNIIFYDRIFNFEIMAGSYLVRNSKYGRDFLHYWADYEYRLPSSFHGTDNGAIHNVFMDLMTPEKVVERRRCQALWKAARDFESLYVYEACVRRVLGPSNKWIDKAKVIPKGKAWARDTWLTNSMWSTNDFVLHGWQKRKLDAVMFASWPMPLASDHLNMSLCNSNEAGLNWKYKDTFIRDRFEIDSMLREVITEAAAHFNNALDSIDD